MVCDFGASLSLLRFSRRNRRSCQCLSLRRLVKPLPRLRRGLGAPEQLEFFQGSKSQMGLSLIYPVEPRQLTKELEGFDWPPKSIIG